MVFSEAGLKRRCLKSFARHLTGMRFCSGQYKFKLKLNSLLPYHQ